MNPNTLIQKQTEVNIELDAHDEFVNMITQINWDLFCTFTYRESVWASEKIYKDLAWTIKKSQALSIGISPRARGYQKDWLRGLYSPWMISIEKHKRGTLHAHMLIGISDNAQPLTNNQPMQTMERKHLIETWKSDIRNAGFVKINHVRKNTDAVSYLVKTSRYCMKDPEAIIDWQGLKGWENGNHHLLR